MPRPLRKCLDCPELTRNPKGRCRPCQQRADHKKAMKPTRRQYRDPTYKAIAAAARRGDYGPCVDCGTFNDLTVDHRRPISQGGTSDPANLVVRCRPCNSKKGARPEQETRG